MSTTEPALTDRLDRAREEANRALSRADVADIVAEVIDNMKGDLSATDIQVYQELDSLSKYIQSARSEIAAIRPDKIRDDFIPEATDELDAVIGATEDATSRILDATELIQTAAEALDDPHKSELIDHVTKIFEASNFQDITGQRITRVVKTLQHIETKIGALVGLLGEEVATARQESGEPPAAETAPNEENLLNGPQMESEAISQDEIDKLLASFD